ncbi:MAG: fused MFS/spermidine synthase [Acidobacteriota bacterium]
MAALAPDPDRMPAAAGGGAAARDLGVAICFFVSGAPALIDQVIWMRAFTRVFGSATYAVGAVLAAFMAGLAIGSALAGRLAHQAVRPVRLYALLELGIAGWALVSYRLIAAGSSAADRILAPLPPGLHTAGLFAASFALLLPPTVLMGATLPLLASLRSDASAGGPSIQLLYGANTLGAAAGALAAGFLLLPRVGFQRTLVVSASLNVAAAAGAAWLGRSRSPLSARPEALPAVSPDRALARRVLVFLGASGAATMGLEVVLSRVAALTFGSSTYSYSIVLAAFLAGIGVGSALLHAGLRGAAPEARTRALGFLIGCAAIVIASLHAAVAELPRLSLELHHRLAARFDALELALFATALLGLLPLGILLGTTFPLSLDVLARCVPGGRGVGTGAAINTVGAAAGAIATSFWLLPALGMEWLLLLAATLLAALAIPIQLALPRDRFRLAFLALGAIAIPGYAVLAPGWRRAELAEGVFRTHADHASYEELEESLRASRLLYDRDGASSTVTVIQTSDGHKSLRVNGKADASTIIDDVQTQYLAGHLPALLHGAPRSALVIGLGSGSTAHALAVHPSIASIDVAEIEPRVVEAAAFFQEINHGVLEDPKVTIHREDGRRLVARARRRYDLIVSEPSNPWIAGVADLFTREHFAAVDRALAADGIYAQWLQGYSLSWPWIVAVLRTMQDVFPEVSVWFTNTGDFLVMASRRPLVLDLDRVRRVLYEDPAVAEDLDACRIEGARGLASRFLAGPDDVRALARDARILVDDLPLLEYEAPRDLAIDAAADNFTRFYRLARPCPVRSSPLPPAEEAVEWRLLGDTARHEYLVHTAIQAYARAADLDPTPTSFLKWAESVRLTGDDERAVALAIEGLSRPAEGSGVTTKLAVLAGVDPPDPACAP